MEFGIDDLADFGATRFFILLELRIGDHVENLIDNGF